MATCRCGSDEWTVPFQATARVTVGSSDHTHVIMTVQDAPAHPLCAKCEGPAPMNARAGIVAQAQRLAQALPPVSLRPTYNTPLPQSAPTAAQEPRRLRVVSSSR